MATEEPSNHLQPPPPQAAPTLPPYPEMIMAAIEALNDDNGSNKSAIAKHIESTYGDLPSAHATVLTHHLNKMKQGGQLIMVKNNYMKPDPNAPPKRGRGRPPKPKDPLAPAAEVDSRPRGRPAKTSEPLASPGRRGRGRPPKMAKTADADHAVAAQPPPSGTPRGRGRPPKVKQAVAAPVGA